MRMTTLSANPSDRTDPSARRLRQALYLAGDLALPLLRSRLAPVDISNIWPQLSVLCNDIALCLCSSAPPPPVLEKLLQSVLPGREMARSLAPSLHDAGKLYSIGWRKLRGVTAATVGADLSGRHFAQHPAIAAADFAHGHLLTVIALLRLLGKGLQQAISAQKSLLAAVAGSPRLGPSVAAWLERHQSVLSRHVALQAQTASLELPTADREIAPLQRSGNPSLKAAKVARDMEILRFYAAQGNREAYWNYLAKNGDAYARLALGVVRNDTINGVIANSYAQMRADQMKVVMSERDWNRFGVALMRADLEHRERFLSDSMAAGRMLPLGVKYIAEYHAAVFSFFHLDETAWTAHVPLSPYLLADDQVGAEKIWSAMLDERFYTSSVNVLRSEGRALLNSGNAALHAGWLGKIGVLTSAYALDPFQAYADAEKIGSWRFDDGAWSRMRLDYPAVMDGSFQVERAPARLAEQLHADRLFRLERQVPLPRHRLDTTLNLPGR